MTKQAALYEEPVTRELETAPPAPSTELAVQPADNFAQMVERLATNKDVDVAKLEKLIEIQERILRYTAESAFNLAFSNLQADLPTVIERAKTDKGTYAPLEDIVQSVRPILRQHGFSISHRTEWPDKQTVKVIGLLTCGGHTRSSEFLSSADTSGSKNAIQALASAVSYGRRYTTKDLLCIVTREEDDDAKGSEPSKAPDAPDGYEPWLSVLDGVAGEGQAAFGKAWADSQIKFRNYLTAHNMRAYAGLKEKARKAGK